MVGSFISKAVHPISNLTDLKRRLVQSAIRLVDIYIPSNTRLQRLHKKAGLVKPDVVEGTNVEVPEFNVSYKTRRSFLTLLISGLPNCSPGNMHYLWLLSSDGESEVLQSCVIVIIWKTELFRLYSVSNQKRNQFFVSDRISDDDFRDGIDFVSVPFLTGIRDGIFANQRRKFQFLICWSIWISSEKKGLNDDCERLEFFPFSHFIRANKEVFDAGTILDNVVSDSINSIRSICA
ncbi:hypothetical protein Syun_006972 [Stephania yunnanensis]|uniref:Uncharacterized protein n=1 Tax=Stephania yunnanensis TaxID=152371 RepID=A0AAP0Q1X5_9MAGN